VKHSTSDQKQNKKKRKNEQFIRSPPVKPIKPELAKRKRKSWKGVTSIRKSARLNKDSVPLVIEIKFSDEESYHGESFLPKHILDSSNFEIWEPWMRAEL